MYQMKVGGITIDVVKKDIKNLHLAVYPPAGRVRVATPLGVNDEAIRLFIVSKLSWIKRQQKKFDGQDRQSEREYLSRESHFYQGKRYLLNVIEEQGQTKVVLSGKRRIDLYVKPGSSQEDKEKVLKAWYRQRLKKLMLPHINKWEKKMGVEAIFWGVRQMKTKWGSCNTSEKRIWLNLELAKKPVVCLEYIIVHELIHLKERHHNEHFRTLMDKHMPNWKSYKDELNRFPVSHPHWEY